MKHQQTNIFVGMNQDSDIQFLKEGEYLSAENVRLGSSVSNNVGTVETLYGSLGLTMPTNPPSGADKIVGKCKDIQYGFVYIFVNNSDGYHRILKLDTNTDAVSVVLKSSQLFVANSNPNFVSATIYDKQLFWCDGLDFNNSSTLRHLDLNLDWSGYDYIDNIADLISNIKRPSLLPITTTLSVDNTINANKLNDQSYQFCYRFVLKNGQQTRFSPISQLAVSGYDIAIKPNKITLNVPLFGSDNLILKNVVKYVEIAFRGKYTEDFKSFKKIDFPTASTADITAYFYNNEAYTTVIPTDYTTEYDNSPLFASSVQYADTRVFWADYQQERYKQPISVTAGVGADSFGNINYTPTVNQQVLKPTSTYKYSIELIDKYGRRTTAMVDGTNMGTVGSITTATQVGLVSTLQRKKLRIDLSNIAQDYKDTGAVQIRRSQNLDYARFIQGRIEQAYYKTGVNTSGYPLFIKGPDFTTTTYSTYDYVQNKNVTDGGATELYLDVSNWGRSNISYTYAEGDRVRFLTTGLATCVDIPATLSNTIVDLPIKRQEGDLLVIDYLNNAKINSIDGVNTYTQYHFYCGDNGFICQAQPDAVESSQFKVVDSTWSGWEDNFKNISFKAIKASQKSTDGGVNWATDNDVCTVCGEQGTLLICNFQSKIITKLATNTTATLNTISHTLVSITGGKLYALMIGGNKNVNGKGTVFTLYTNSILTIFYSLLDITTSVNISGNILSLATPKNTGLEPFAPINRFYSLFITENDNSNFYLIDTNLTGTITTTLYTKPITVNNENLTTYGCSTFKSIDWLAVSGSWTFTSYIGIVGENGIYLDCETTSTSTLIGTITGTINFRCRRLGNSNLSNINISWYPNDNLHDNPVVGLAVICSDDTNIYICKMKNYGGASGEIYTYDNPSGNIAKCTSISQSDDGGVGDAYKFIAFYYAGVNKMSRVCSLRLVAPSGVETLFDSVVNTPTSKDVINYGAMIEVYTPASELSEQIYYEVGNVHKISEYASNPTPYVYDMELLDGDCFYIQKQFYGRLWDIPKDNIISMSPTKDTWSFWHKDIGRPNVEDLTVDYATNNTQKLIPFRTFTSNIIFSNPYIQGTKTNGLCSFELLNYKQLPIEYGGITALQVANNTNEDGTIMLSIHKHEIVSIYIGKVQYTDVAGNNVISLSDQVLGSFRTTNGSLGSVNPESIAQYNSAVYGFDAIKGVVWRYSQNGVNRLSDIGMRNYFYNQGKYYLQNLNYANRTIGEYNNYFDEYCLTLPNTNETMVWSERYNRWICSRNFSSDIGDKLKFQASIYNKNYVGLNLQEEEGIYRVKLYKTDVQGQEAGKLIDVFRQPSITCVANKDSNIVKNWNNIRLQTDQCWDIQANTEDGQVTYMIGEENEFLGTTGDLQELENNFFTPILNDATIQQIDRYEGQPLKSQVLTIKASLNKTLIDLKSKQNNIIKLYNITTFSSISYR